MSYVGNVTMPQSVVSYSTYSSTPQACTATPAQYLSITYTPTIVGFALATFNIQMQSTTGASSAIGVAHLYIDGMPTDFTTQFTNPDLNHYYNLTGSFRFPIAPGPPTSIQVYINYITTDSQTAISGHLTVLSNLN